MSILSNIVFAASILGIFLLTGYILAGILSYHRKAKVSPDLERTENCQRCGRRSKWLYFCECVHSDENIDHALYVVKRALERQATRKHLLPDETTQLGLQLVKTLRVMLKDEIERTKL